MFHRLQKKTRAQKSTIFALAIFIACILAVPLWILGFKKSLAKSKVSQKVSAQDSSIESFDVLKENFSAALEQFQDTIQQLEQTANVETTLPSYPQTGDQPILPRSE